MSNRNYDVTSLGELLIDFTENGTSAQGNPIMEANPGGAPCNVLAMLERLGKKTAFIGKVGKDMFGNQLKAAVEEVGIDTRALIMDEEVHTTLAFVHTYPHGDRDFSFYPNPGADMMLTKDLSLLPMRGYVKLHVTPLRWQKKAAVSSPLTRICARHSGNPLRMPVSRLSTVLPNVTF